MKPGSIALLEPHPGEQYTGAVEIVGPPVDGWVLVRTAGQDSRLAMMVEAHRLTPIQEAAA